MRTRRAAYPTPCDGITFFIRPAQPKTRRRRRRRRGRQTEELERPSKRAKSRLNASCAAATTGFDALHDDLLVSIMVALSSTAASPADLVNTMLTCKRFCAAGTHPQALACASVSALAVTASGWSDGALRFLTHCADAGNVEACYILGMIHFYCLPDQVVGTSLIAKAAMSSHAAALHSLAVIQFNGSGGTRKNKDLKAGVTLCARAASLGHVNAMRELGHCLQDGYGVAKQVSQGRRLLLEANAREAAAAVATSPRTFVETALHLAQSSVTGFLGRHLQDRCAINKLEAVQGPLVPGRVVLNHDTSEGLTLERNSVYRFLQRGGCSLLSDFGCNVPPAKLHVANKFMVDWFAKHPPPTGLRLCSHANCGRPETRRHEFRRCSACGTVNYCSRACQALDWKLQHKQKCLPVADWEDNEDNAGEDGDQIAGCA